MLRKSACHVWRCVSTRPGSTRQSVASITSASPTSRLGATATIAPSSMRTSPLGKKSPTAGSTVITVPPWTSVRSVIAPPLSIGNERAVDEVGASHVVPSGDEQLLGREARDHLGAGRRDDHLFLDPGGGATVGRRAVSLEREHHSDLELDRVVEGVQAL